MCCRGHINSDWHIILVIFTIRARDSKLANKADPTIMTCSSWCCVLISSTYTHEAKQCQHSSYDQIPQGTHELGVSVCTQCTSMELFSYRYSYQKCLQCWTGHSSTSVYPNTSFFPKVPTTSHNLKSIHLYFSETADAHDSAGQLPVQAVLKLQRRIDF